MSISAVYFSPTKSTQKVTETIAEVFGIYEKIDLTDRDSIGQKIFCAKDVMIVGVPSYGGRVPAAALEKMKGYEGNGAKAVLITVYGNRAYEDTLKELQDFLEERNFKCVAAVAAIAEHSIMHQFAAGRPDAADLAQLSEFADRILHKTESGEEAELQVPGDFPYRVYKGVPLKPKAGKDCTKCGLCAAKCPVGAIPTDNPKITDKSKCISCMRCLQICPSHARRISRLKVKLASTKMKKACEARKDNELFL